MKIDQIISEATDQQNFNEVIYNLRHRVGPDTVRLVSNIIKSMAGDLHDTNHDDNQVVATEDEHNPTGSTLSQTLADITTLHNGTPEQKELYEQIRALVNRDALKHLISRVVTARKLPASLKKTIFEWFTGEDAKGTIEQRNQFLEDLLVSGYLETSALISPEPNNFNSIARYSSIVYDSLKQKFMDYEGKFGSTLVGKGELFCIFFATNVFKGTRGDLVIQGSDTEVKAIRSRFMATTGYGSTSSFFETYKGMLRALVPNAEFSNDRNDYNWSYKGLHTLSDLFRNSGKPEECKKIIDRTLQALYLESTPEQRSRVADVISNDGSFDVGSFLRAWVLMQYEYYKSIDGFDGILFLNPENYNFMYIEDSSQLDANWDLFHINPSLSWKELRNVTSQVTLI